MSRINDEIAEKMDDMTLYEALEASHLCKFTADSLLEKYDQLVRDFIEGTVDAEGFKQMHDRLAEHFESSR